MRKPIPTVPMASCFALCGFAVAIVTGLVSDNPASSVIGDALLALVACYFVAVVVAKWSGVIAREHLDANAREHPIPGMAHVGALNPHEGDDRGGETS